VKLLRSPDRGARRLALAAFLLASACRAPEKVSPVAPATPADRPNILLVTVDTLRADHLSAWGYGRATSPVIDRLAAGGLRFDAAAVQWPKTGPSFASMLSSTYPKDNGIVRQIGIPVPCSFTMLPESLQRTGYSTHAVVANGAVGREFYFDQGFDTFLETWKLPPEGSELPEGERPRSEAGEAMLRAQAGLADPNGAGNVTRLALAAANNFPAGKPWFLWVHYLDPHFPYSPPAAFRDRFQGDALFDGTTQVPVTDKRQQEMAGIGRSQVLDGETRLGFYVARYDAEIAYVDSEIGRLFDAFSGQRRLDNTLVAFTSDHGESLGDHNYYFNHGRFGFQTCLRVPLILSWPGKIAPGVDREPVELVNLAPTLLEAAGIALPGGVWAQGRSLWPRIGGKVTDRDRIAFSEAGVATERRWMKVARDNRFALHYLPIRNDRVWVNEERKEFVLFDLEADPAELHDVSDAHPEVTERLKRELSLWWGADPFACATDAASCDENRAVDAQTTEQLKALGYL